MNVKASLEWKSETEHLPHDITLSVPKDKCNLNSWHDYIKESLMLILASRVRIKYDIVEDGDDSC